MTETGFTDRQLKFVTLYEGNGVEAARKAGYGGSYATLGKTAHDLLKNPKIVQAIRDREAVELSPLVATRLKRQQFWSKTMVDAKAAMHDRLRASELLGKSEGDFVEKLEWTSPTPVKAQIDFSSIDHDTLLRIAGMARCPASCCSSLPGGPPKLTREQE